MQSHLPAGIGGGWDQIYNNLEASRLRLYRCEIRDCTAISDGGAIYVTTNYRSASFGGDVRLMNSTITNCTAGNAGGAMYSNAISLYMADVTIRGGRAVRGGALSLQDTPITQIHRTSFIDHETTGNGGVVQVSGIAGATLRLVNSTIDTATAALGGAFDIDTATVELTRCDITNLRLTRRTSRGRSCVP